jgi:hypothetical protein
MIGVACGIEMLFPIVNRFLGLTECEKSWLPSMRRHAAEIALKGPT